MRTPISLLKDNDEQILRCVLDATNMGIWDWDIRSGNISHSHQWCKITGLDGSYLNYSLARFTALLHEEDRADVLQRLENCMEGRELYQSEHRLRLPGGRVIWVLERGDVIERDADGKAQRMVGSLVDINERKAVELALGVRTELLNTVFELSPDGFVAFDAAHCVSYSNPAFTRMTGIGFMSILGMQEIDFIEFIALKCIRGGTFCGFEKLRQNAQSAENSRELLELNSGRTLEIGLRSSQTNSVSQILYLRDVTHEAEIDRMKSEFLETAAHELRTPMSSIYGFAELLLQDDCAAADRQEFLGIIFKQAGLMVSIVNELLDLARIEERRGKDFVLQSVNVQSLLRELVSCFNLPSGRAAPSLLLPDEPLQILADWQKMLQALSNVLSNAYKYSPNGGEISIELRRETAASGDGLPQQEIQICIRDQGIGMTAEQVTRVFERFYRADSSGKIAGTGLGMSIVREIMTLHAGRALIDSQFGAGTSITLCVPEESIAPPITQSLQRSEK